MVVLWILLLSASPFTFWCALTIGTAIALYEFFRMIDKTPGTDILLLSVLTCLIPVLSAADGSASEVLIGSYLALLGLIVLTIFFYTRFVDPLAFLMQSGFAVFYIGICASFLVFGLFFSCLSAFFSLLLRNKRMRQMFPLNSWKKYSGFIAI
ncbi:MAG: hypothetical protein D3914_13550 [Candidatus Electrothrix sp. LOE2]|nr:hypothetical protein [Candidatus Electrothrix sp. LOE2]